jgi:hypothetical protein
MNSQEISVSVSFLLAGSVNVRARQENLGRVERVFGLILGSTNILGGKV